MKKILAVMISAIMLFGLVGCGKSETTVTEGKHIYVLTAAEDHGWTGSVASFAKEKVEEINKDGNYSAEVITSGNANEQIVKIEDIVAKGEKNAVVVIQPIDDTVQSAIQELIDAEIPYVAFDRIIDAVSSEAISNVKGDNEGIGASAAEYFVSMGLKPGDKVYVYEGDTSSVTSLRNQGFTNYLTGKTDVNGEKIADDLKWTDDDLNSIVYSGSMSWSRSNTKEAYESLMGNDANADIKWFYSEDDELTMGIIEALNGGGISDSTKNEIYATKPVITGCGGLDELYDILRGNTYQNIVDNLGGLMSVTYSPAMIQTAIQDMVDYLEGKDVNQDHVIKCENVTTENVDEYPSF